MEDKRGISPVIATVLLIVVAIVLFLLIFMWIRGFQKEAITKQGTPIETMCLEVNFDLVKSGNTLQIINTGNVLIYNAKVYVTNGDTTLITENTGTIAQGSIISVTNNLIESCTTEKIKVIPVLLGTTKSGAQKEYVCEKQAQIIPC